MTLRKPIVTWYVKTFQKRQLRVLNPARINVFYWFVTKIWYIRGIVTPNIPTKFQDNPLNHSWRNLAICRRTDTQIHTHTHIRQLMSYELVYTSIHSSIIMNCCAKCLRSSNLDELIVANVTHNKSILFIKTTREQCIFTLFRLKHI